MRGSDAFLYIKDFPFVNCVYIYIYIYILYFYFYLLFWLDKDDGQQDLSQHSLIALNTPYYYASPRTKGVMLHLK